MKYNTLFFLSIILISGCQKFEILDVSVDENSIVFSGNGIINQCSRGVYITNFDIEYVNGKNNSVAWSIDRGFNFEYKEGKKLEIPFQYGETFTGIITRVEAINLTTGTYNYGGTFACLIAGDETPISVKGSFSIGEKNGVLKLN